MSLVQNKLMALLSTNSIISFFSVYSDQKREYFGLRDFYSLIKMVLAKVKQTNADPTDDQLITAIQRNFGGYFGDFDPTEKFLSEIHLNASPEQKTGMHHSFHQILVSHWNCDNQIFN